MIDLQKRRLVAKIAAALIAVPAAAALAREIAFAQSTHSPQSTTPSQPPILVPSPPLAPSLDSDPKTTLKRNQAQIRDDVEKLYALALELRAQVETTETTQVLSLPVIQKAEQIEKLSKQIKTLARD
jgi:hypothetical protein